MDEPEFMIFVFPGHLKEEQVKLWDKTLVFRPLERLLCIVPYNIQGGPLLVLNRVITRRNMSNRGYNPTSRSYISIYKW